MNTLRSLFLCASILLLTAAPSAGQLQVLSDLNQEYVVAPGGTYQGSLVMYNASDDPVQAHIYQRDFLRRPDGLQTPEAGTLARSNARWLDLPAAVVMVPPKTKLPLMFAISVPADLAANGTYWSAIIVEPQRPPQRTQGVTLNSVVRYATVVATNLSGSGRLDLKVTGHDVLRDRTGTPWLLLDVENTGERHFRPTFKLEIYDLQGQRVDAIHLDETKPILPGSNHRHQFNLSQLRPGRYKGVLMIQAERGAVFGAQVSIVVPPASSE